MSLSPRPLPRADRDAPLGSLQSAGAQPLTSYLTLITLISWEFPECLFDILSLMEIAFLFLFSGHKRKMELAYRKNVNRVFKEPPTAVFDQPSPGWVHLAVL